MGIKVQEVAYHRNGIGGEGFYAVLFTDGKQRFVATVFDGPGQVAVLDRDMLAHTEGVVTFGLNSWRGDNFEAALRFAIKEWDDANTGEAHRNKEDTNA